MQENLCEVHGVSEMTCACPQWSETAKREFEVRGMPALVPKKLQMEVGMKLKLYPLANEPQRELENIHNLLKEQRYLEAEDRLARIMNWRMLER
jgi:hypothetical protein